MTDDTGGVSRRRASLNALKRLIPYALSYKGQIIAALVALFAATGATLILPIAARRVIDHGFSETDGQLIDAYFGMLMAVVGVLALASAARYYFVTSLGERVVADLREAVFRHLVHLDATFFDSARSGEIVSRLTADTTQVKTVFGVSLSIVLRNSLLFLGSVFMMVWTSPKLSALVLMAIPVIVLPLVFSGRVVRRRSRNAQDRLADASAFAAEAIGAVRTMQAFRMENPTANRFAIAVRDAFDAARFSIRARSILTAIGMFLVSGSVVGVLWYGAQDVLLGGLSSGTLSQFVLYAVLGASSLGQISEVYGELAQASGSAERLGELLAVQSSITAPENPVAMPVPSPGTIAFENVGFAYPGRSDYPVLSGLDIKVDAGERIAIVGPSGAGKSTLFQLLLRFYDPQEGIVRVDGVSARNVDPAELRARVAMVSQEPAIFAASIADNIRYGRYDGHVSKSDIENAAGLAAADEFIRALPNGYDTIIGERGIDLSGGQRQRIAIARAILKDAPILLLDEATSALDAESERQIQKAFDHLMAGRTTLVIAHRLATIRSADRILVMDHGMIVEQGNHDALIARGGLYARLAKLQFSDIEENGRRLQEVCALNA